VFQKNPFFTFAWNSLVVGGRSTGLALLSAPRRLRDRAGSSGPASRSAI
jgi:hypothetical protein